MSPGPKDQPLRVRFRFFQSTFKSWETLFGEAADFASQLDPRQLIGISHSADQGRGVVVVWYYGEAEEGEGEAAEGAG